MSNVIIIASLIFVAGLVFLAIMFFTHKKENKENSLPSKEIEASTNESEATTRAIRKPKKNTDQTVRIDINSSNAASGSGDRTRYRAKNNIDHGEVDPLNEEVSQFQTAPTILNTTYITDEVKERMYFEQAVTDFHNICNTLHPEDIKNFCNQYKVSSIKRGERSANAGVGNAGMNIEMDEEQVCRDANLWLLPHKNERYRIFPGITIRTSFKTLIPENAATIGEIFRGIMLFNRGDKFEVAEPAIAEKRNGVLSVVKIGKLIMPSGESRR